MAWLYTREGEPTKIPEDQVQAAVASGKFFFAADERVPVVGPDGQTGTVTPEDFYKSAPHGWTYEGADAQAARRAKAKYGGIAGGLEAAGAGALRGASVGLSDPILKAAGVAPETLAGLKEAHPFASGAGEMAGILGISALSEGALGPEAAAAARITPAGLAAGLGRGAEKLAVSEIGKTAEAGLARRLAEKVIPHVIGGASETALYGAGQEISDATLGDRPLSAQKLLSSSGMGALFGGATTGFFGLTGAVGREGLAAIRGAAKPVAGALDAGTITAARRAINEEVKADPTGFLGKLVGTLAGPERGAAFERLKDTRWRALARTEPLAADKLAIEGAAALEGFATGVSDAADTLRKTVKPSEIADGLKAIDVGAARAQAFAFSQEMRAVIREIEENPSEFLEAPQTKSLGTLADGLEKRLGARDIRVPGPRTAAGGFELVAQRALNPEKTPAAQEIWDALELVRKQLGKVAKVGDITPEIQKPALARISALGDKLSALMESEVFGEAGAAQAKYNGLWSRHKAALDSLYRAAGFGVREGVEKGRAAYEIAPDKFAAFFKGLGSPGSELQRVALDHYFVAAQDVADAFGKDARLEGLLSGTYGKITEVAEVSKAMADLKRASGAAAEASAHIANLATTKVAGAAIGLALGGPVGGVAGAFGGPILARGVLAVLDRAITERTKLVDGFAHAIAKGVRPGGAGRPIIPSAFRLLENLSFSGRPVAQSKQKNSKEAYRRISAELDEVDSDWTRKEATLRRRLAPISDVDPHIVEETIGLAKRKIDYLRAARPQPVPMSRFTSAVERAQVLPAESDIAAYARTAAVVANPMLALEDLAHGRLSIEGARAVRETDPEFFAEMKAKIILAIENSGEPISYQTKLQLSLFFSEPMDPSLEPAFITAMQETFAGAEAQEQGGGQGSPLKSTRSIKSIKAAASAAQRLESSPV